MYLFSALSFYTGPTQNGVRQSHQVAVRRPNGVGGEDNAGGHSQWRPPAGTLGPTQASQDRLGGVPTALSSPPLSCGNESSYGRDVDQCCRGPIPVHASQSTLLSPSLPNSDKMQMQRHGLHGPDTPLPMRTGRVCGTPTARVGIMPPAAVALQHDATNKIGTPCIWAQCAHGMVEAVTPLTADMTLHVVVWSLSPRKRLSPWCAPHLRHVTMKVGHDCLDCARTCPYPWCPPNPHRVAMQTGCDGPGCTVRPPARHQRQEPEGTVLVA